MIKIQSALCVLMAGLALAACDRGAKANPVQAVASVTEQAGQGEPYLVAGTQVWNVPDPVSGRNYQVYVALPPSYEEQPQRAYPVLYVTDAHYAFPLIRQFARRMNLEGPVIQEHILVGLSYAEGDSGPVSRTRDYTPSAREGRPAGAEGGGPPYQTYLKSEVLPFIEQRFRADPQQRIMLGHSFGGLLGAQIMFSEPELFSAYVLGSPSLWFDNKRMFDVEARYAADHTDLKASVFMYVGEGEHPAPTNSNRYDMVADNRLFEQRLRSRSYPGLTLRSIVVDGEDHLTVAPIGFMRALEAVLPAK